MSQIILRERVIKIKAGDTFDQALQGNVMRVTAGAVPLRVQDRDGQLDFTLLAGEKAAFPSETPGLILSHTSGVDQTFTIQVGKGVDVASALLSGSVVISGTPTVINGGGVLTSITSTVKTKADPVEFGACYKSTTNALANTPDMIVSPGANVNGLIVHSASIYSYNSGAGGIHSLIAKAGSVPLSVIDGDVILGTRGYTSGNGCSYLDRDIKIPAGKGLYFITWATEVNASRSVLYTLL